MQYKTLNLMTLRSRQRVDFSALSSKENPLVYVTFPFGRENYIWFLAAAFRDLTLAVNQNNETHIICLKDVYFVKKEKFTKSNLI